MFLLFVGLVGCTFFVLLVWAGTMVYRLYNPEQPLPFEVRPVMHRERVRTEANPEPVGVRKIRADRRRELRRGGLDVDYEWGQTDGIPESWHRDLWHRRN